MNTIRTATNIPTTGFLRIRQILALIPISPTSWWTGVASGKYPKGIKLGARTTVWRAEDIYALMDSLSQPAQRTGELKRNTVR